MSYTYPHFDASALVIIDVQNDFILDDAPSRIDGTLAVLPSMAKVLQAYRQAGLPVVHIVRLYLRDGSNVDLCRRGVVESGKQIVSPGTYGSQIPDMLRFAGMRDLDHQTLLRNKVQHVGEHEAVIYKPRWGAFFETPLNKHLQSLCVDTLVFCGCNFPNCPRTSIYEASERDYRVVLVSDAISEAYEKGFDELKGIGVTLMTASDIIPLIVANKRFHSRPG